MRVRMTETAEGSLDGINPETFKEGKTYSLPEGLARTFIDRGVAEEVSSGPASSNEPEPDSVEEEEDHLVSMERTKEGSPYYQFRDPDGNLITEVDDGEEKAVKVLGQQNASDKRDELEQQYE